MSVFLASFWGVWGIYMILRAFRSSTRADVVGNLGTAVLSFLTSYHLGVPQ